MATPRYPIIRGRAAKKSPNIPPGIFNEATSFVLYIAGEKVAVSFVDILDACDAQRLHDPKVSWIVRVPDGAVLKVRNATSAQLKKLVSRGKGTL